MPSWPPGGTHLRLLRVKNQGSCKVLAGPQNVLYELPAPGTVHVILSHLGVVLDGECEVALCLLELSTREQPQAAVSEATWEENGSFWPHGGVWGKPGCCVLPATVPHRSPISYVLDGPNTQMLV